MPDYGIFGIGNQKYLLFAVYFDRLTHPAGVDIIIVTKCAGTRREPGAAVHRTSEGELL